MEQISDYVAAFPGRNAFYLGLDPSFYNEYALFRMIYDEAGNFFNEDLFEISYKNPTIKSEFHTVCLIIHCYGIYQLLIRELQPPGAAIGFSQGEFTAIACAEGLQFLQVLELVHQLELLILENKEIRDGSMMLVYDFDRAKLLECIHEINADEDGVSLAIYLSNNQNVVSGTKAKVSEVAQLAKKRGARWAINLETQGAFHSPICNLISIKSDKVFDRYFFSGAAYPVYSCIDGEGTQNGPLIKRKISKQIRKPVLWDLLINNLNQNGFNQILELGPGSTISGYTRINNDTMACRWINNVKELHDTIGMYEKKARG